MMIHGHRTVAAPFVLGATTITEAIADPPPMVLAVMGFLIVWSCSWNDLDMSGTTASNELWIFSRAVSKLVQIVSFGVYLWTRTPDDAIRKDAHRGFTHTLEGCLLFSMVTLLVTSEIPFAPVQQYAWYWAFSVMVGTVSHLAGDIMTPSGVPLQITLKINGMRWQRYALGWEWHKIVLFIQYPTFTVVTVDGRHKPKSRPGLFRTDGAGEHYIAIPLIWAGTAAMAMLITGTFMPVVMMILGL